MNRLACVIPFFDGSATIGRALTSLLHSPLCDEVILVSDASREPVRSALQPHHVDFEGSGRLRVVEMSTNLGQAAARNVGAALSTAPLISFLDQDDEVLPEFHALAVSALHDAPDLAAVEVGAAILLNGCPLLDSSDPRYRLILDSVPWNIVVRRSAFWACGGFPTGAVFRTEAAGEDIAFKTALKSCFKVAGHPMVGVRHHIRHGSATDRFLSRTSVSADGTVVFNARYPAENDGTLAAAMGHHVSQAIAQRSTVSRLLGFSG